MTSSISGSRMEFAVHLPQVLALDVSVHLCGRDVSVTEHLLHRGQVGAPLEEVGGEGVPQCMRCDPLADVRAPDVLPQDLPYAHPGEWLPARVQEYDALGIAPGERSEERRVGKEGRLRWSLGL